MSSLGKGIPPETLQQIRDRIDIVDIVSRYVTLSKTGQNYKGLCPFHSEKTPSFSVSPTRQMFHCFGCGVGGDGISFLMKREGMEFIEVVRDLAQQAGVTIPESRSGRGDGRSSSDRERYEQMHALTASWFQGHLQSSASGNTARQYVEGRGIAPSTMEEFGLGYALPGWNGLSNHLMEKGFTQKEVVESGLVVPKEHDGQSSGRKFPYYDRFRDRIMFPIANARGRVIAFGGRTLNDQGTPKYINSPETSFFNKGRELYGLNKAREVVSQLDRLILVEGYFDVIALSQAGVKNVVAPLGTALTSGHVQSIRRMAKTVVLLFDGDAAGVSAVLRTLDLFLNTGIAVKVIVLPSGEDPDTFIRSKGIEPFVKLEADAPDLLEFAVGACLDRCNVESVEDRIRSADEVLRIIQKTSNPVEKDEYLRMISDRLGIRPQVLVERYPKVLASLGMRGKEKRPVAVSSKGSSIPKGSPEERELIRLLLQDALGPQHLEQLQPQMFKEPLYRRIMEIAFQYIGEGGTVDLEAFRTEALNDQESSHLVSKFSLADEDFENIEDHVKGCLESLKRKHLQITLDGLIVKLRLAEREQRKEDVDGLVVEIDRLRNQKAMLMVS